MTEASPLDRSKQPGAVNHLRRVERLVHRPPKMMASTMPMLLVLNIWMRTSGSGGMRPLTTQKVVMAKSLDEAMNHTTDTLMQMRRNCRTIL